MGIFWFVIIYSLNACREEEEDGDDTYGKSLDEFEYWPF